MRASSTVTIVDRKTGQVSELPYEQLGAVEGSVVKLPVGPDEVSRFANVDGDLVITLRSGQELLIADFFLHEEAAGRNELVLQDAGDVLWWGQYEAPWSEFAFAEINAVGDLVAAAGGGGFGLVALAGLGVAGIAAAASGGGGGGSNDNGGGNPVPPAPEPPEPPTVEQQNAQGAGGTAPTGTTVVLRDENDNQVATADTDADGNWFVPAGDFPDGSTDGFQGSAAAVDADGNESDPVMVGPIDGTLPDAPVVEQENAEGVGGTAEANSTITLRNDSTVIATTQTDSDGNWFIPADHFPDGETDGFEGSVTATDAAGNESQPADVGPIDGTPPDAPVVEQENSDGVAGTAEPGSQIRLRDDQGELVATTTTGEDGDWFIPAEDFPDGETDGFEGSVTATDDAGNESGPAAVGPIDGNPPEEPAVEQQNVDGVGGTAEPETTVLLFDSSDQQIASAPVDDQGNWFVAASEFPDGQTGGFEGYVVASDAAGNLSAPAPVGPLLVPAMPEVTRQDLLGIGGEAEPEVTVHLRDSNGDLLATTTSDDQGAWFVAADDLPDDTELPGFEGEVVAVNGGGFRSEPAPVSLAEVWAFDIAASPLLVIDGITASEDLGSLQLPGYLLGVGTADSVESDVFAVPEGSVGAVDFQVSSGSVLTLLDGGFDVELQQLVDGSFETVGTLSGDSNLLGLDLLGLLAPNGELGDQGLAPGEYKLILSRTGGVELLSSGVTLEDITLNLFDPDEIENAGVVGTQPHSGNLLADPGKDGLPAEPGSPDTVLSLLVDDSYEVPGPDGLEIQGQYGVLTVQENGDFEYAPTADAAMIGQEERFGFRLEHPNGEVAEAELIVEIGFIPEGAELQQGDDDEAVSLQGLEGLEGADGESAGDEEALPELEALLADEDGSLSWSDAEGASASTGDASQDQLVIESSLVGAEDPDASSYTVV